MSAKRNWMIGCGIGCGLAILIVLGMGGASYFLIKRLSNQADELSQIQEQMTERFGTLEEHRIATTGALPRDRVERFLVVREGLLPARLDLEPRIDRLAQKKRDGRFGPMDFFTLMRDIPSLVPSILEYIGARTEALLANDMSLGEYLYLYTVLYFSWLEHDIGDGPPFPLITDDEEDERPPSWNRSEDRVRRERSLRIRKILHELLVPLMERQLEAARAEGEASNRWPAQLETELKRLRAERTALPWEHEPPGVGDLEDLRSRVEESYSPLLHPIEIGTHELD